MGKVVAFGETAVGIGLIIAAVGGAFMNLNFMLAGSASTNPVLLLLGFLLVLAWKTAGYIGLDRVLLPLLGTPWSAKATSRPRQDHPTTATRLTSRRHSAKEERNDPLLHRVRLRESRL